MNARGCEPHEALLKAWLDGELPAESAAEVRSHAESCPVCRAVVSDYEALSRCLRSLVADTAPAPLVGAIHARRRAEALEDAKVIRGLKRVAMLAAAVLVISVSILLASSAGFFSGGGADGVSGEPSLAWRDSVIDCALRGCPWEEGFE